MKTLLLLAMVAIAGCGLTACEPIKTSDGMDVTSAEMSVYVDPGTGCQYLITSTTEGRAMTPRLRSDGGPLCESTER